MPRAVLLSNYSYMPPDVRKIVASADASGQMIMERTQCNKCGRSYNCDDVIPINARCTQMRAHLRSHSWSRPKHRSTCLSERKLRHHWDSILRRRTSKIGQGAKPSDQQLSPCALALVNEVENDIWMHVDCPGAGMQVGA